MHCIRKVFGMWDGVKWPNLGLGSLEATSRFQIVCREGGGGLAYAAPTPCSYAYIEYRKKLATLKLVQSTEKYQYTLETENRC